MKKNFKISTLQDILNSIFRDMDAGNKMEYIMLHDIWNQSVGERIAEKTQPVSVRNGVLLVNVANSVWMQELVFLKDKILQKLNNRLKTSQLKSIRFKIGHLSEPVHKPPVEPLPTLNNEQIKKIEIESSRIQDSDLRHSFENLMKAYLQNKKKV